MKRRHTGQAFSTSVVATIVAATLLAFVAGPLGVRLHAQGRFLAKEDIVLLGIGLQAAPADQTVPINIATIVSTFLQSPAAPPQGVPPFAPGAVVLATLRGPSYPSGLDLTTRPNTPFNIPPLGVPGLHTLENIRLVSNGDVLLYGSPQSVTINVIEKLLITQITARPLTADEIRQKGIVFDKSSFQAYNFAAAFAIQDQTINLSFPVLLPTLQGAAVLTTSATEVPTIPVPSLPSLQTIIPDTLKLQTQVPNLSVIGFTLKLPPLKGLDLVVPPIPGVIVIPGNIGFLNQFFSVLLMVGNVAPDGSNLVVTDLTAHIALPPGHDHVLGSGDDPLRMAHTANGDSGSSQLVVQPGPDGKLGTADDFASLGPGQSAQAEFLVEGLREGTHTLTINMAGMLNGLPVGPVPISGEALGAVLVRNPTFTLTFTHPDTVNRGEPYTLDVTVTNSSSSPANFVSLNLLPQNVSGATIVGDSAQQIDSIPPADSATVHFSLISKVSGKVTAATLDSDENVAGRFKLKTAVGELGVPVSPDSLVLPSQASSLPGSLRDAAIGLLGKAWAVATAPPAALPPNITRFSQKIVMDRGVQVAEAGFRVSLHEPIADSALQLEMDFTGSDFGRLPALYPNAGDLSLAQADVPAFDTLRRVSVRGDAFAQAVADLLTPSLSSKGVGAFQQDIAQKIADRPGHISVLIGDAGGPLPFNLTLLDAQGNQVGGTDSTGKVLKQIPFSDYLRFTTGGGAAIGEMTLVSAPTPGAFTVRLDSVPSVPIDTPFTLSMVVPDASGRLRQIVFQGITASHLPAPTFAATDPYRLSVVMNVGGTAQPGLPLTAASDATIIEPPPSIVSVVQQREADRIGPDPGGLFPGRVVAVLFNKEVTLDSAQDGAKPQNISNYSVDGNAVVGVAVQPGHRIAFLALRDPIGPFVQRQLTVSGVADARGQTMASQSVPIEATVTADGAVVSGRMLEADGTPVSFGNVRLYYIIETDEGPRPIGISSKSTDVNGQYSWDYVLKWTDQIAAVNPESGEFRQVYFTPARNGQRLNIDIVLLGRGTFQGRTLAQNGVTPLQGTSIRVTSLTDQSQYSATTDDQGRFTIARIPVGNIVIEAVNVAANAQITLSDNIMIAGGTLSREIALLDVRTTQITIQHGTLTGRVLEDDGATPAAGQPVIAYYQNYGQPGVPCPRPPGAPEPLECPVAIVTTDSAGAFTFSNVIAGALRLSAFDQKKLQQGGAGVVVPANGTFDVTVLLAGGLGTVHGTVFDASRHPIAGARVGGGLSLTTTDANGQFTLTDVPIGHRTIVAVSDQLGSTGQAGIDLVRDGETVNVTLVLNSVAAIAGTVFAADGISPVANNHVYLIVPVSPGDARVTVIAVTTTDQSGHYIFNKIPLGEYTVSAFKSDFTDGNVVTVALKFNNQTLRADVKFRGSGGRVTGVVYDDDGVTPLKALVGISGDRVAIAGGQVGTGFQRVQNFAIVETDFTTGQFSFSGLWTGAFTVSAAGQFSPDPISLNGNIPSPGTAVQMNLRLQATSRISGTVFQPDGVTPVGTDVVVSYHSDAFRVICNDQGDCTTIPQGIQQENVVTDANGKYVLSIVNAGTFTLTTQDPSTGRKALVHGSVRAGQHADMPIRLLGIGQVTVNVFAADAVTPIPGARVHLLQVDYPNADVTLFTDTLGSAAFSGGDALSEGSFVLMATDMRNGLAGRAAGKITSDGQQLTVTVYLYTASGTARGTVFRPDGFTPVPNADVIISNSSGPLAFTVTDSGGSYSQDLIPLGPFTVEVFEAATARRGSATGRIDLDQEVVPVNITEAALGLVRGTGMASGSLQPLVGAAVRLTQQQPSGRFQSLLTTTGTDGTFSFPGVALGSFSLSLSISSDGVSGYGQAQGAIGGEGQVVDIPVVVAITQPLFGRIQGTTYNGDGSTAANTQVAIICSNCAPFTGTVVTAGADGTFTLDHVQIGRFVITARSQTTHNIGSASGQIAFDSQIADVPVVLAGLSQVTGNVTFGTVPAAGAQVVLTSLVTPICAGSCTVFADGLGNFSFTDVPAGRFSITATDPLSGLKGAVSDTVAPSQTATVRIVLQPSGGLRGRVLFSNGTPASGITGDLVAGQHLFVQTAADGTFSFDTVALIPYTLTLQDPLGPGIAKRSGTITGAVDLGDITLNDVPFAVASSVPVTSAVGVPMNQALQITFNEPTDFGTVNAANVSLSGPNGVVSATLAVGVGGTTVTLRPVSPLNDATRYSVRIAGVTDTVGKGLASDYVFSFTTVDITPPSVVELSPAPNTVGVALASTIRVQFSEPVDPTRFSGSPLALSVASGPVSSRLDYLFGNTVLVLTPLQPLGLGATYRVRSSTAFDLSGNAQTSALDYTFTTTSLTPPQIGSLVAANNGSVIEGTATAVTADIGNQDVSFVEFYLNDVFSGSVRSAPFTFRFQANANLGRPGDQIKVSAVATDTSGIRGQTQTTTFVTVVADQAPTVAITAPVNGAQVKNGDRVSVTVRATDDVGVVQMGYKALTGQPQDAAARTSSPPLVDRAETFGFNIPADAVPGSTIAVQATGVDTKGQSTQAAQVSLIVLDSVAPTVTITGASTGNRVTPGRQTTVVVSAQDLGGVDSIAFTASGAAAFSRVQAISPAQNSVVTSFTFTVASSAQPGQSVTLSATAIDRAGNTGAANSIILPVADSIAPTVHLRTLTGRLDVVRGATVNVIAEVDDETAVARVDLAGTGALTLSDSKPVSPPVGSASIVFSIAVPASVQPGQVLNLQAAAVDTSGNVSLPATLSLTVESLPGVDFPSSALLVAGENQDVTVQLTEPAPSGGIVVNLTAADPNVVSVATTSLHFAAGESSKTMTLTGVSGGTTTVTGKIQGVARGSMTVAVRGGIVSGTVFDPQFNPVGGAQVTVGHLAAVTDASGHYFIEGWGSPQVSVKALDPLSSLLGFATGTMDRPNGFVQINIVLIPAGSIEGIVRLAGGQPAGAGVKVLLFTPPNLSQAIATTFTDAASAYSFPLVAVGSYTIDASDTNLNHGRSSATITGTGQVLTVPVTYLGRGTVSGTVFDAAGHPVPNARITLQVTDVFGVEPSITLDAGSDGTFMFPNAFVGTFTVSAHDPVTGQGGVVSGLINSNGQVVAVNVSIAPSGNLAGVVFRSDGVTPVPGATVTAQFSQSLTTVADDQGRYSFAFLPIGSVSLTARDVGTRGIGSAFATLTTNGATVTANINLLGQGSIVTRVTDASGNSVVGASVTILARNGAMSDTLSGQTGADGTVVIPHVLAGTFEITVTSANLKGSITGTLADGEVKHTTVSLQPTASIAGAVFAPDGQTPVGDALVALTSYQFNSSAAPVDADGTFRFDNLPLGTYTVSAYDSLHRLRTFASNVVLNTNAQVANEVMTFIPFGQVTGRVVNPDSSSASSMHVQVQSFNPILGRYFSATTDAAGFYQVDGVPAGNFAVTTGDTTLLLLGEGSGVIAQDGQVVNVDILLQSNAVSLPYYYRYDANNFHTDFQRNGSSITGYANLFAGDGGSNVGAPLLDIISAGVATRFAGTTIGTFENHRQGVTVRQQGVAGLNVTRKIYVPNDGYFARHLDVLSNPTANPITVDLRVTSNLRGYSSAPAIITTSSGDTLLSVVDPSNPDRWAVIDDSSNSDPWVQYGAPAMAIAFDGPGAPSHAGSAGFNTLNSFSSQVVQTWTSVTVPPGGTVAYMYFFGQETSRAAAAAAAQRLTQVPPEALAGLSPAELQALQNFVVPQDGIGTVAALPSVAGTVTGRVLDIDGTTPVPNARVTFTSNSALFGRNQTAFSNSSGLFTFTGTTNGNGNAMPIAVDAFTLLAQHSFSGILSQSVPGNFAFGQTTAAENVVFANTAIVQGSVRRTTGAVVTSGSVQMFGNSPSFSVFTNLRSDGTFVLSGIPEGTFPLRVTVANNQGTALVTTVNLTVVAGQVATPIITMPATGTVSGVVSRADGSPSASARMVLHDTPYSFQRQTYTDTSGSYTFADMPVGSYVLEAYEPRTNAVVSTPVTVSQDQTTTQNVTLTAVGNVHVQVNFARGVPAANSLVRIFPSVTSGYDFYTDATGRVTIPNARAGPFTVTAYYPNNTRLSAQAPGAIANEGDSPTVIVTLPAAGTVTGRVTYGNGNPAPSYTPVEFFDTTLGYVTNSVTLDSNGNYVLEGVPVGTAFAIRVTRYDHYSYYFGYARRDVAGTPLTNDGEVQTIDAFLPAFATVRVTALNFDGTPLPNARVEWQDSANPYLQFGGYTNAAGQVTIAGVMEGSVTINVRDPNSYVLLKQVMGTIRSADEGATVDITAQMSNPSGSIVGTVFAADGITPVPNGYVSVYNAADGYNLSYTQTAADGTYQFANIQAGDGGFTVQAYSPSGGQTVSQAGTFATQGEVLTVNLTLPVLLATVRGTAFAADGSTPVPYAYTQLNDPNSGDIDSVQTDQNGVFEFPNTWLPVQGFLVKSRSPNDYSTFGSQPGIITTSGETVTVNVTIPIVLGTVNGVVYGGDGASPWPSVYVNLRSQNPQDSEGGVYLSTYTQPDGTYQFNSFFSGTDGFVVTINLSVPPYGTQQQSGTFATQGQQVTFNFTLPASVVKGRLTYGDGSAPPQNSANVFVTASDGGTYYGTVVNAQGDYVVFGAPVGAITVTGQDGASGLTVMEPGTIASIDTATVVNLTLPASGTITGQVLGIDGSPVALADVALTVVSLGFDRYTQIDATGTFRFDRVPLGTISLQALFFDGQNRYATATAVLTADGEIVTVNISAAGSGEVNGRVLASAGGVVPNASVAVESFGTAGPFGHFSGSTSTNAAGTYSLSGVPPGPIQVLAMDPGNSQNLGLATGTLSSGSVTIDVTLGNATRFTRNLDGADGFRYDVLSDGRLNDGGTVNRQQNDAYDGAYALSVNGVAFSAVNIGALEQDSRQIVLGPVAADGFLVTRKIFVPSAGGFARYLEMVTNSASTPRQALLTVGGNLGSDGSTRVVVAPSATGTTYAVTDQSGSCCDPALGHVFSGLAPPLAPSSVFFATGNDRPNYSWQLTVPANGSVIIMHFGLQRDYYASSVAATAAQALRDLADPNELVGLTTSEKALIQNFVIP